MWGELLLITLWAADKNLLVRLWAFFVSNMNRLAWSALTLYSNWKSTNDMIKDGYHVGEAYLYEYTGETSNYQTRAIDVLRIFREHIQLQTFTNTKRIALVDFIEKCCEPDTNFSDYKRQARYELVVSYTFDHRKYKIVYGSATESIETANAFVRFPVYTANAIREKTIDSKGSLVAAMLTVNNTDDGIDIFDHLKKLAGPMENFYADTEYAVKRQHLHHAGLRIATDTMHIKMVDMWGNEFLVPPDEQIIRLEKK